MSYCWSAGTGYGWFPGATGVEEPMSYRNLVGHRPSDLCIDQTLTEPQSFTKHRGY